jgi:hypothetical protein
MNYVILPTRGDHILFFTVEVTYAASNLVSARFEHLPHIAKIETVLYDSNDFD